MSTPEHTAHPPTQTAKTNLLVQNVSLLTSFLRCRKVSSNTQQPAAGVWPLGHRGMGCRGRAVAVVPISNTTSAATCPRPETQHTAVE